MTHQPDMSSFGQLSKGPPAVPHGLLDAHYALAYHPGLVNHCPGCAGTHWLVGRTTAQCPRCDTALPLVHHAESAARPLFVSRFSATAC